MKKIIDYTQTAFYIFQYNTRKINAIIKRSQIHRIKIYVMLMAFIFSCFTDLFAIENTNIPYGEKDINYVIDENSYISYNGIRQRNTEYYYIQDGQKYTAYCIDLGLNGAEYGEGGHYIVNAQTKIEDKVLKDIILNCYPYKSVEELGVENEDEAKFASQFAIWCYTSNLNMELMVPTSSQYARVDSCIRNIYNSGISGYDSDITLEYNESLQTMKEVDGIKCFVKYIELYNVNNVNNIEIVSKSENVKVKKEDEKYMIYSPVDYVDNNEHITANLELSIQAKENIVLLGTSLDQNFQRVAVTLGNTFDYTENISVDFESNKSKILVKKVDKDTQEPLEGVVYSVEYDDGKKIGEYKTDKNGEFEIILRNEESCVINIVEKQEKEYYYKDYGVHRVEVNTKENKTVTLTNEKKKGIIEIIKKTKEYNEITGYSENTPLSNVSFYIYDENLNKIDDVTTDEFGVAQTKYLKTGTYYIEEYKTVDGYKSLEDRVKVEISYPGENVQVNILNDNIEIPKKLPVTGR